MTALTLDSEQSNAMFWALINRRHSFSDHRDKCRKIAAQPTAGAAPPEQFAGFAEKYEQRIAVLDGIATQFPDFMRDLWAGEIAQHATEVFAA